MKGDERVTWAREFLDGTREREVNQLPPSVLMAELSECRRRLGQVLDFIAWQPEPPGAGETAQLAAIRAVLAAFDWERDDRQYALEQIEMIAGGDDE